MKKFSEKSPCELSIENIDRSCALFKCKNCENDFAKFKHWFQAVKITAICKAPFIGGILEKRYLAIVYECPNCFEYFWFHTTESHKNTLEDLLNEGVIKND